MPSVESPPFPRKPPPSFVAAVPLSDTLDGLRGGGELGRCELDSCSSESEVDELSMGAVMDEYNTRLLGVLDSMQQEIRDNANSLRNTLHVSGIVDRAVRRAVATGDREVPYVGEEDHKTIVAKCQDGSVDSPVKSQFERQEAASPTTTVSPSELPSHQQLRAAISDLSDQDPSSFTNHTLRQIHKVLGGGGSRAGMGQQQQDLPQDERGLILLRLQLLSEDAIEIRNKLKTVTNNGGNRNLTDSAAVSSSSSSRRLSKKSRGGARPISFLDDFDTLLGDGPLDGFEGNEAHRATQVGTSTYPAREQHQGLSSECGIDDDDKKLQSRMIKRLRRACEDLSERTFQTSQKLRVSEAQREELAQRLNAREETLRGLKSHFLKQMVTSIASATPAVVGVGSTSVGGKPAAVRIRSSTLSSTTTLPAQPSSANTALADLTEAPQRVNNSPSSQTPGGSSHPPSSPPPPLPGSILNSSQQQRSGTPPPTPSILQSTVGDKQLNVSSGSAAVSGTTTGARATASGGIVTGFTPVLGPAITSSTAISGSRELISHVARMAGIPVEFVESLDLEVARRSATVALQMEKLQREHRTQIQRQRDGYKGLLDAKEKEIIQMQLLFRNALRALQGTHANVVSRMTHENADLRQSNLEGEQTAMQKAEEYYELKMNERLASLTQQYEGRIAYLTDNLNTTNNVLNDTLHSLKTLKSRCEKLQTTNQRLATVIRHAADVEVPFASESGAMGVQIQLITAQNEIRDLRATIKSLDFNSKQKLQQLQDELVERKRELAKVLDNLKKSQTSETSLQAENRKLQAREAALQGAVADQSQRLASANLEVDRVRRNSHRPVETDAETCKRLQGELDIALMDAHTAKSDAEELSNELRRTRDQLEEALAAVAARSSSPADSSPPSPRGSVPATPPPGIRRRQSSGAGSDSAAKVAQEELAKLRAQLAALELDLGAANRELSVVRLELKQKNIASSSCEEELLQRLADLNARYDATSALCERHKKTIEELQKTVLEREDEVDDAFEQIESLGKEIKSLEDTIVRLGGRVPERSGGSRPTSGRPPSAPRGGRPPTPTAGARASRPESPLSTFPAIDQHQEDGGGTSSESYSARPTGHDVVGLTSDGNTPPNSRAHSPSSSLVRKYSSGRAGGQFASASRLFRVEVPTVEIGVNTTPVEPSSDSLQSSQLGLFRPGSAFGREGTSLLSPRGYADAATSDRFQSQSVLSTHTDAADPLLDALSEENALLRYRLCSLHNRLLFVSNELQVSRASLTNNLVSEFDLDVEVSPSSVQELEEEIRFASSSMQQCGGGSKVGAPPRPLSAPHNPSSNRPQSATVLHRPQSRASTVGGRASVLTSRSLTPHGSRPSSSPPPTLLELLPVPTGQSTSIGIALQNRVFHEEVKRRATILETLCRDLASVANPLTPSSLQTGFDAATTADRQRGRTSVEFLDPSHGKFHLNALPPSKPISRPGSSINRGSVSSGAAATSRRRSAFGVEMSDEAFVFEDHTEFAGEEDAFSGDAKRFENYGDSVMYEKKDNGDGPDFVVAISKDVAGGPRRPQSARTAGAYSVSSRLPARGLKPQSAVASGAQFYQNIVSADQHAPTSSYIQPSSYFDVRSRVERISSSSEATTPAAIRRAAAKGLQKGRPASSPRSREFAAVAEAATTPANSLPRPPLSAGYRPLPTSTSPTPQQDIHTTVDIASYERARLR